MPKYYKVLAGDQSCHGGAMTWPLPTDGQPGEWVRFDGEFDPCYNGIHLTSDPAKWFDRKGLSVYEAEFDGGHETCSDDKIVCRNVRLMRLLTPDELAGLNIFLAGSHEIKQGKGVASDSATVRASGSATVRAYGSATVRAYGSATVRASGSATVRAYNSATVEAYDSATVEASDSATVEASDSATVWASGSATVWAYGSATVRAYNSATVRAYNSATVRAYNSATVQASGSATVRAYGSATVRASDSATVDSRSRAQVTLSHLAIQIDRSRHEQVIVHRSADAAVTLADAATPAGVQPTRGVDVAAKAETDHAGRAIPADEPADAMIAVWEVEPHLGGNRHTHFVERSWQNMLDYVRSQLDIWLEQAKERALRDGVTLTFRLKTMSKADYAAITAEEP